MGPDFQGNFGLVLQWPDLTPFPPGVDFGESLDTSQRSIRVDPDYIERVPIAGLLERYTSPIGSGPTARRDPSENLDLMTVGEPLYGLEPRYVDFDRLRAFADSVPDKTRYAVNLTPEYNDDVYITRNRDGSLRTLIRCTSRLLPDGVEITGRSLRNQDTPRVASCTHTLTLPEYRASVRIAYLRVFLKDWKRIDERVRTLFARAAL